jgi:hypothetical protein
MEEIVDALRLTYFYETHALITQCEHNDLLDELEYPFVSIETK